VFVLVTSRKPGVKSPQEIDDALKKAKPLFDKRDKALAVQTDKWQREIDMLERRVEEAYEDLDLPGGDTIAIRTCLSNPESKRLGELKQEQIKSDPVKDADRLEELMYEILGTITANPLLTVDWFRQNEGKYAMVDAVTMSIGYYEKQVQQLRERNRKVKAAQSFREDESGTELRDVPALSGVQKS
jgi:hypothetical protein